MSKSDNSFAVPMIHFSVSPEMVSIDKLISLAKEEDGWKKVVLVYDKIYYNYYDKNEDELKWLEKVRTLINSSIPDKFRNGVHLVAEQASFMGEDIYLVDGNVSTTTHCKHKVCDQYKVLWRGKTLYCAECNCVVERSDVLMFSEEQ